MPTHAGAHRMAPFPENSTVCVGSTDGWLALHRTDAATAATGTKTKRHTFFLHNPFTATTVPLAELKDILDDAFFEWNEVCKVIIRSSCNDGDHLIAVMTDHTITSL
uniref:KIB1-4 beta-propeller domain-containing protein n=1 Tax=Oryza barthii TaxID=65489 RepID=A0A0D3GRB2_9ORYZ